MDQNRNILFIILYITFSGFNTQFSIYDEETINLLDNTLSLYRNTFNNVEKELTNRKITKREILSNEEILKNIEKILVNANQNISQIEISIKGTSKKTECCACPSSPESTSTSTTPINKTTTPATTTTSTTSTTATRIFSDATPSTITTTTTTSTTTSTTTTVPACTPTKPAIIVSGGWPNKKSVELYHSNFTHWLTLPNLIDDRAAHTQNGLLA